MLDNKNVIIKTSLDRFFLFLGRTMGLFSNPNPNNSNNLNRRKCQVNIQYLHLICASVTLPPVGVPPHGDREQN